MIENKKGTIVKLSFEFAVRIVCFYKRFVTENREYVLSKQLLHSGTAVGALVRGSQNAESEADFIHKPGIAQKEEYTILVSDAKSLLKMIKSAIITSKVKYINDTHNP